MLCWRFQALYNIGSHLPFYFSARRLGWLSEQILNGTLAKLGYTVPFTSEHAGKYVTEEKSRTDITTLKTTQKKANDTKHSKTKLAWLSRFFTTLGQEMRWAYSTTLPSPHGINDIFALETCCSGLSLSHVIWNMTFWTFQPLNKTGSTDHLLDYVCWVLLTTVTIHKMWIVDILIARLNKKL